LAENSTGQVPIWYKVQEAEMRGSLWCWYLIACVVIHHPSIIIVPRSPPPPSATGLLCWHWSYPAHT
jgi:hypothetical protein